MNNGQLYPIGRDIKKSYNYYQGIEQRKRKENELFGSGPVNKFNTGKQRQGLQDSNKILLLYKNST